MQIKGLCDRLLYDLYLLACPFIRLQQGVCAPVRPVHMVTEHADGKRMGQELVAVEYCAVITAIIQYGVDRVRPGIR